MKRRKFTLALLSFSVPSVALSRELHTAKAFAAKLPRPKDLGVRWQPVHPDRWLTVSTNSITAMYERRAPEPGKLDASVIADCFIYTTEAEAQKALEAKRAQISAYPTAVIKDVPDLTSGAFSSYHKGEEAYGSRVTFRIDNVAITISPSQLSAEVARIYVDTLKTGKANKPAHTTPDPP
jgi:hypothetical protein